MLATELDDVHHIMRVLPPDAAVCWATGRAVVRAEAEDFDFDSALAKVADKFEKAGA